MAIAKQKCRNGTCQTSGTGKDRQADNTEENIICRVESRDEIET
jgi:hypothetical protein